MVPSGTGKLENLGKMGRHFPVRKSHGILSRLEKSGNFTQNSGKIRENYSGKLKKCWKSQLNLSASNSENPANMVPYFLKKNF